ncbi:putative thioredoxin reductase protein [Eutypa lata UCREL1]|uniref:Putative thioredoxin reductase protein n=1 Tax=Eutypa lata (strain UCR-EL1) TaxID=1287681 RepID=M7SQP2_EUTLA|nr:putative thioredoxin reductase protein [Eutypa lata UCREL1]
MSRPSAPYRADHKSPEDYRNAARKNILENYSSIQFADVAVAEISKESDSRFKVRNGNGKVTIYTNGDVEIEGELNPLVAPRGKRYAALGDRGVFVDGSSKEEKFLVHNPQTSPQGRLDMAPSGDIKADAPFWQTSVPGVFAVGDCSTPYKVIASAVTGGCNAGVMASAEIQGQKYSRSLDS